MSKLSAHPLVCIVWDDAHMSMDEYTPGEVERDFHKAEQVKSFGLLVREDERGITLAQDEGVSDGKFRHIIFIPAGMVVEKIDLGIPKRKVKRRARKSSTIPITSDTIIVSPEDLAKGTPTAAV